MPPSPPPPLANPQSPPSGMSLPVVALALLGILITSIFLLAYYVFVTKCCLDRRRSGRLFSASRPFPSPGESKSARLDLSAIRAIPTFRYSSASAAASECAVCLLDFLEGERLRLLPVCAHAFHVDCIDTWLQSNSSCPLCRADITDPFQPPANRGPIPTTQTSASEAGGVAPGNPRRKLGHSASRGDECLGVRRERDELLFSMQPLRRSVSMDSSCHRHLCISVQENPQQIPDMLRPDGGGSGGGAGEGAAGVGRVAWRSFFPFGHGRSSIQPACIDV